MTNSAAPAPLFPNMAKEFPTFDQSTLPAIPAGFVDTSWVNDQCPNFLGMGDTLGLFIDFADPADRDFPESSRFTLHDWDGGSVGIIAHSDDWSEILAHIIARQFVADLKDGATAEQWATMRLANVGYGEGVCASHDFCDANMVMHPAFESVMGYTPIDGDLTPAQVEEASKLWGAAWDIAKRDFLTATPEEAAAADPLALLAELREEVRDWETALEGERPSLVALLARVDSALA